MPVTCLLSLSSKFTPWNLASDCALGSLSICPVQRAWCSALSVEGTKRNTAGGRGCSPCYILFLLAPGAWPIRDVRVWWHVVILFPSHSPAGAVHDDFRTSMRAQWPPSPSPPNTEATCSRTHAYSCEGPSAKLGWALERSSCLPDSYGPALAWTPQQTVLPYRRGLQLPLFQWGLTHNLKKGTASLFIFLWVLSFVPRILFRLSLHLYSYSAIIT